MTVYCIPGLGADERLFDNLSLSNGTVRPLKWLKPDERATLSSYAGRLLSQIDQTEPHGVLGVSFGGMIAIEMAQLSKPTCTIVVSSVRGRNELPWYGRLIGRLRLHRLYPTTLRSQLLPLGYRLIGAGSEADRKLIQQFVRDTDERLFQWSLDRALRWEFAGRLPGLIHIHGTADRLLPAVYVHPDFWIDGGTHLMIYNRAEEVGRLIDKALSRFEN